MEVFVHHIYEYEKGIRNLVLHTSKENNVEFMVAKLEKRNIAYKIYKIGCGRVNVFFGSSECVQVIEKIGKTALVDYTAEEDFLLGIMLGYDRRRQCERYLKLKEAPAKTA